MGAALAASMITVSAWGGSVAGLDVTSTYSETPAENAADTTEVLEAAAPLVVADAIDPVSASEEGLHFEADLGSVVISSDAMEGVHFEEESGKIRTVSLPNSSDSSEATFAGGVTVYENSDHTQTTVTVGEETVTYATVIEQVEAPTEFSYDYSRRIGEGRARYSVPADTGFAVTVPVWGS